ncbi:MAG: sensor histidine kinase [Stellaceae bacterium]
MCCGGTRRAAVRQSRRYAGYVADINGSGRHLLDIVNDSVLDLSKLAAGSMRMTRESVDPAALAEECIKIVEPLAVTSQARIRTEISGAASRVNGDTTASAWTRPALPRRSSRSAVAAA